MIHLWDIICFGWVIGYISRPLWRVHWKTKGRPTMHKLLGLMEIWMEAALKRLGLVTKGQHKVDAKQGGRKRQ